MREKVLILASSSLRRARILKDCGIRCRVIKSFADELRGNSLNISTIVRKNARLKAQKVAEKIDKGIILGVDTLVLLKKKVIGKPRNRNQARELLKLFSGKRIDVYTGLCLIDKNKGSSIDGLEKTSLWVERIEAEEIDRHLKYLGPFDKAGGFSIEGIGATIFDNIRGSYFNVLGLPMVKLAGLMKRIGLDIFDFIEKNNR